MTEPLSARRRRNIRIRNAEIAARVRAILADRFPATFKGKGEEKPPLKIGIDEDILLVMPEIGARDLSIALGDYTWGPSYCRNVTAGAPRIDLGGAHAGLVTEREAEHAAKRLEMFAKSNKKRAPAEGDNSHV